MKKIISVISVLTLLLSAHAFAAQDEESVEICKDGAVSEGLTGDKMKEYVDKCVNEIAEDEKREQMEIEEKK